MRRYRFRGDLAVFIFQLVTIGVCVEVRIDTSVGVSSFLVFGSNGYLYDTVSHCRKLPL